MTIINDDSRVVNKLKASLNDNARVVIYDHHMYIVQATEVKISLNSDCRENELPLTSMKEINTGI